MFRVDYFDEEIIELIEAENKEEVTNEKLKVEIIHTVN